MEFRLKDLIFEKRKPETTQAPRVENALYILRNPVFAPDEVSVRTVVKRL